MREEGRQRIGSKVRIGATLETSSEGGRQRLGARWNSERLRRFVVLEKETRKGYLSNFMRGVKRIMWPPLRVLESLALTAPCYLGEPTRRRLQT